MRSTQSLRSFPNVASEMVPMLIDDSPLSPFRGRSSIVSPGQKLCLPGSGPSWVYWACQETLSAANRRGLTTPACAETWVT